MTTTDTPKKKPKRKRPPRPYPQVITKLTRKMAIFLRRFARGDFVTQTALYMEVFDCAKSTAVTASSKLIRSEIGAAYLKKLDDAENFDYMITKGEAIGILVDIAKNKDNDTRKSDKIAAIKQISSMTNMESVQKVEVAVKTISIKRV